MIIVEAGLLAYNVVPFLLMAKRHNGYEADTIVLLLTVARQPVNCTRFPIKQTTKAAAAPQLTIFKNWTTNLIQNGVNAAL